VDCLLLHSMCDVNKFVGLSPHIPKELVSQDTLALLEWYKVYMRVYPTDTYIDLGKLSTLVSLKLNDVDSVEIVQNVIKVVQGAHFSPDSIAGVYTMLNEAKVAGAAAAIISKYQGGGDVDIIQELHTLTQDAMVSVRNSVAESWDRSSVESMLSENHPVGGVKWSLEPLRDYVGGIHPGDSILIAARPDRGKGSFVAYTLTDWAAQVVQEYGEDRPMLWLINEGKSARSRMRLYNAGLKKDTPSIAALGTGEEIDRLYSQAIKAPADYIRCKEIHGLSMYEVERIVEAVRPSVCVLDMVANIKTTNSDFVQAAEERWQTWREILVRYDVIGIGTSQISAPGDGWMFPGYSHLKDSKTSIQGAVDVCVILGASNDPLLSKMRGISTPKNKRSMPGKPECVEAEVVFEKDTCEFI